MIFSVMCILIQTQIFVRLYVLFKFKYSKEHSKLLSKYQCILLLLLKFKEFNIIQKYKLIYLKNFFDDHNISDF